MCLAVTFSCSTSYMYTVNSSVTDCYIVIFRGSIFVIMLPHVCVFVQMQNTFPNDVVFCDPVLVGRIIETTLGMTSVLYRDCYTISCTIAKLLL